MGSADNFRRVVEEKFDLLFLPKNLRPKRKTALHLDNVHTSYHNKKMNDKYRKKINTKQFRMRPPPPK